MSMTFAFLPSGSAWRVPVMPSSATSSRSSEVVADATRPDDAGDSLTISVNPGLLTPSWRLLQNITIIVAKDDDGWAVSDGFSVVYGDGETAHEAIEDYIAALIEYYELTARGVERGDAGERAALRRIRTYVQPV